MNSYLAFYIPITIVVMLVLEACKRDEPVEIVKRALMNFAALTAVLALGGLLVILINKYL